MTGNVYPFPKVSELAQAWAELLAAKAMSLPMTEIPEYVEQHRLDAGVDMSPGLWLRYVLIKVTRLGDEKPVDLCVRVPYPVMPGNHEPRFDRD